MYFGHIACYVLQLSASQMEGSQILVDKKWYVGSTFVKKIVNKEHVF